MAKNEMDVVNSYLDRAPVAVDEIIRQLGIEYVEVPLPDDQSGRIDIWDGNYKITVNSRQSPQRRRFTAAHELAHYLLHRDMLTERGHLDRLFSPAPPGATPMSERHEIEANKMAAQILMPRAAIETELIWKHYDVDEVARSLEVSRSALDIRLKTLGIDPERARVEWERREPPAPHRLDDDIPF